LPTQTSSLAAHQGQSYGRWPSTCPLLAGYGVQFTKMRNAVMDAGQIGMALLTACIAQERLRDLLALARTGPTASASATCVGRSSPGTRTPRSASSRSLSTARGPRSRRFIATGHCYATSEGVNRMIKLCARNTNGFRNPANQRLRTRCVTTRRARGHLAPLNFVDPVS
jgi:transposase